jgi:hypothetical protein
VRSLVTDIVDEPQTTGSFSSSFSSPSSSKHVLFCLAISRCAECLAINQPLRRRRVPGHAAQVSGSVLDFYARVKRGPGRQVSGLNSWNRTPHHQHLL